MTAHWVKTARQAQPSWPTVSVRTSCERGKNQKQNSLEKSTGYITTHSEDASRISEDIIKTGQKGDPHTGHIRLRATRPLQTSTQEAEEERRGSSIRTRDPGSSIRDDADQHPSVSSIRHCRRAHGYDMETDVQSEKVV